MTSAQITDRFDAQTYAPPKGVQEAAARAVTWIEQGKAGQGFTPTGRTRAGQLSRGEAVSLDVIERMASYFARHAPDTRAQGFDAGEAGFPTPGRVAWDAWGGDAGMRWATAILDEIKRKAERDAARMDAGEQDDAPREGLYRHASEMAVRLDDAGTGLSPEDRALLSPPRQTPDGSWVYHALIARADERKRYEWGEEVVPWEELSDPETLASFEAAPVTLHHPSGLLRPDSPEGQRQVVQGARILRADAVDSRRVLTALLALPGRPTFKGVSVGWDVARIDKGHSPPAQRGLRANHLALTPDPRVPGAGPRLDAAGAPVEEVEITLPDGKTAKIPKTMLPVYEMMRASADNLRAEVDRIKAERDRLQGAADAGKTEAAEAARMDAIKRGVEERLELRGQIERVMGSQEIARFDAKPAREVREALVKHLRPEADPSKWSSDYLSGTLSALCDQHRAAQDFAADQVTRLDSRLPAPTPGAATSAPGVAPSAPTMNQINASMRGPIKK